MWHAVFQPGREPYSPPYMALSLLICPGVVSCHVHLYLTEAKTVSHKVPHAATAMHAEMLGSLLTVVLLSSCPFTLLTL